MDYANVVRLQCIAAGLRSEVDGRQEKMGFKIREAEVRKIPCMAVVGEKETAASTVSLRFHGRGDMGVLPLTQFVEQLVTEVKNKGPAITAR